MKFATVGTNVKTQQGELVWTDDAIRWNTEEGARQSVDEEDETEDEDEDAAFDIFKKDPRRTFSFSFPTPPSLLSTEHNDAVDSKGDSIQIDIQGYEDESDQIYVSTGLTLWRSAQHLCDYMLHHAEELQARPRILELGAGLGLNGILAYHLTHRQPNAEVVITDGDTNALAQLRQNLHANMPSNPHPTSKVVVEQLLWGESYAKGFLKVCEENHEPTLFDILIASDVVYVSDIIRPLWETAKTLLDPNQGVFYFAYCSRRNVPVKIESVLEAAEEFDFSYVCADVRDDIYIYEFRRRKS